MSNDRILVVDDDETVLESLKGILESEGYSVDTAEKGRQALERFESESYDLVLLDIKIPDIEGTKLLETLHDRFPETVKIMLTGYPTLANAIESLNSGADAYLVKPVNPRRLLKAVKARIAQQEKARNNRHEKIEQPEKGNRSIDPPRSNSGHLSAAGKENKPLDEMIETALSLLQDEGSGNRLRVKNFGTKSNTAPIQKPESPEQSFWFSLANLDMGSTGKSETSKKPRTGAKPG